VYRVAKKVFWTSPPDELDATFLELNEKPSMVPLTLHDQKISLPEPPPSEPDRLPRLYVIGHPSGRDLELSLQDNRLLACNDRLIHYRTPTEGGSSGSLVFEHEDWRVVALHHKGSGTMRRINGEGTYEANEGIAIQAVREATQNSKPSREA
jgi:Trypsin-like peptidase domain